MPSHEIQLLVTMEPIAPDTIENLEDQIRAAAASVAQDGPAPAIEASVSFERRAPITTAAAAVVAAIRLVIKDVPELLSVLKRALNRIGERLRHSNMIDATLRIDEHVVTLKGPDDTAITIRLGDELELRYAPKEKPKGLERDDS